MSAEPSVFPERSKAAPERGFPGGRADRALSRLAPFAWIIALGATVLLFAHAVPQGEDSPLKFVTAVLVVCAALWFFPISGKQPRRTLLTLFLLGFGVRLGSAVLFDRLGAAAGDPYAGSPDAWAYDQWARRLIDAWSELRDLNLHAYDAAGRWDVGFHYVLAVFYAVFGESVLAGRALVAFFGAVAVVLLFLVARRVAGERVALLAGLAYAFWVSSIAWSGYSVLRDSLVWVLTLLAIWLALRVASGSALAALGFFLALVSLRSVRPYAATSVVIGLGVAGVLALIRRSRAAIRPAVLLASAALATEVVFFVVGFPSIAGMVVAYRPKRVLLKTLPRRPASRFELRYPGAVTRDEEREDEIGAPKRLFGPSLPANTLRFFLSPPAWAPVRGDIRRSDNWQLPGMWLWYLILPVSAVGFVVAIRGEPALKGLVITAALFIGILILVGRGDLARQREMAVPIVLLCFAIGLAPALRRPRLLVAVYVLYAAVLGAGILYHRGTLRARGVASQAVPAAFPGEIPGRVSTG